MKIERFEVAGLAQFSYIVSDGGEAVAIDPIRDVDGYVRYLAGNHLRLTHVLETHIHADFASGSVELARAAGAELALSAYDERERYRYAMLHRRLGDGDSIGVGALRLEARHTPGHTPEHLCFLLFESKKLGESSNPFESGTLRESGTVREADSAVEPVAIFSGDLLFVGSLGRPDLLGEEAKRSLARELYRSVSERIAGLPDGLLIYPGHGAGSLCGSGIGEQPETTLGRERATNPYLRYGEAEFVERILASVPPMPDYYLRMKVLNAAGAPSLEGLPGAKPLACEEVQALSEEGATLVDLRGPEAFAGAHIAGAINIGAGQSLSLWAGWLLDPAKRIVLVADYADAEAAGDDAVGANAVGANAAGANAAGANEAARRALVRVGLDRIAGSVAMPAWIAEGREFRTTRLWSVAEVERERGGLYVLDVRSEQEWAPGTIPGTMLGSIPGAHHIMLGDLPRRIAEVPREAQVVTVCGSGYRSIIAASLLERAGDRNVGTMAGGMMAWRRRGLAVAV